MSKKRRDWSMHGRAKTDDFLNPFEAGKTALALGEPCGGHSARSRLGGQAEVAVLFRRPSRR